MTRKNSDSDETESPGSMRWVPINRTNGAIIILLFNQWFVIISPSPPRPVFQNVNNKRQNSHSSNHRHHHHQQQENLTRSQQELIKYVYESKLSLIRCACWHRSTIHQISFSHTKMLYKSPVREKNTTKMFVKQKYGRPRLPVPRPIDVTRNGTNNRARL